MNTKFTPGPWRWWPCKDGSFQPGTDYVQIAAGNTHVAKVLITSVTEPDLALIAAAPDLLQACQLIVEAFDKLKPVSAARNEPLHINAARAAIARATGAAAQQPPVRVPQPRMIERKCAWCKGPFMARSVDVKRGWGKFCSKSCKASKQEKRTGQYRAISQEGRGEFSDAHLFSNEEHDCNKD